MVNRIQRFALFALMLGAAQSAFSASPKAEKAFPSKAILQEMQDLVTERTQAQSKLLQFKDGPEHTRLKNRLLAIKKRLNEIEATQLGSFQRVATEAVLGWYEEDSYAVILEAKTTRDIQPNELLLFHADGVFRTSGTFAPLETKGESWYFRPNAKVAGGQPFIVRCIQDHPIELENVKQGRMPNSTRVRDPKLAYRTLVFDYLGRPLAAPTAK